ncbi:rho GTPase-activating protein 22 isoform X3 [Gambusia affinis]|uniref:rho GTPase-activating protein 22 isoform X3 n=1 Tax=Gambusia affinis TaxID=33528 RepID=UPI001CDC2F68|nr:rho GTPase-activating protein 22 isoform X3 [Gambusia affinis]
MKSSRTLPIRKNSKQSARSKSMVLGELSRLSRPCSPQDQEKPLKAGWLKRQRSIMKNWQLRWFVLRSEALYFYKDQDESKAQGCIPLQGSQVNEVSAHQDEPGRHLFEIVPGVFGQHLQVTMSYESQCGPQRVVPVLVELCASFIREQGLKEEGLFRAPGQTNHVRELQDVFDRGEIPVFDSSTDVHTVASLLKLYIRELPEPIIPFSKYTQFLSCAQLLSKDKETAITELSKQVKSLPQVNYNLLKYICKFLDEVQLQSIDNKMSVQNLATVFGPNILRPRVEDPVTMMEGSSQVQHLMTILISEHSRLYPNEDSKTEVRSLPLQHELKRSKVEWVSQEETDPPNTTSVKSTNLKENHTPSCVLMDSELPTSNPLACEKDENSQTKGNDVNKLNEKGDEKENIKTEGESEVAVSPSKQAKALPSWRCSFKGNVVSGGSKVKMGGSAGDVSASGGSNWLMNGLSSLRAHRRTTSSGERVKDSTLSLKDSTQSLKETTLQLKDTQRDYDLESPQTSHSHRVLHKSHRLSAYDNVAPSSLSLPADTSSIWTPFEISLSDTEGSNKSTKPEQNEERNTEVGNGINDEDVAGTSEEIPNKLTQLKQELKTQKVNYETRIRKLEESCSKYQCQVSRLKEDLDQERKKCHMLEIRLRNSERAHQDAENRNILLQREMEEFFKTFGDLTTGTARTN